MYHKNVKQYIYIFIYLYDLTSSDLADVFTCIFYDQPTTKFWDDDPQWGANRHKPNDELKVYTDHFGWVIGDSLWLEFATWLFSVQIG